MVSAQMGVEVVAGGFKEVAAHMYILEVAECFIVVVEVAGGLFVPEAEGGLRTRIGRTAHT